MSLPKSYLTSSKNLASILNAVKGAQAPDKFTTRFLYSLGFSSSADRLVIGVLKAIGFLLDDGTPTERYFRFLDQTQSDIVLAEGVIEGYADLFQVNKAAYSLSKPELVGKLKTLSQGQYSDSVIEKMAMTFSELCKIADFKSKPAVEQATNLNDNKQQDDAKIKEQHIADHIDKFSLGGLHYNIQIILPESRDPKVYDALFRSLREHLP